jgi:hypothetical protein
MICPKCKKEAPWVENKEKYGRNYGKSYMCYYCKECDTYVGCHNNTRKALGTMADKETQQWRMKAHQVFDPLWRNGKMTRKQAYEFIGNRHIGESDIEQCQKIINIVTYGGEIIN